jgi:hypothetical protein
MGDAELRDVIDAPSEHNGSGPGIIDWDASLPPEPPDAEAAA